MACADTSSLSSSSSSCSSSSDCSGISEDIRKTIQTSLYEGVQRSSRSVTALIVGADLLEAKHHEQRHRLNTMREQVQQLLDRYLPAPVGYKSSDKIDDPLYLNISEYNEQEDSYPNDSFMEDVDRLFQVMAKQQMSYKNIIKI